MISVPRQSTSPRVYSGRVLRLVEKDVVTINGRRSVTAVQAVVDVLTWPDSCGQRRDGTRTEEQVALIDHLLRQDYGLLPGLTEDPRTRDVALLADPLAESRPESIMRVRLHEAGLTDWKPQIQMISMNRPGRYNGRMIWVGPDGSSCS